MSVGRVRLRWLVVLTVLALAIVVLPSLLWLSVLARWLSVEAHQEQLSQESRELEES